MDDTQRIYEALKPLLITEPMEEYHARKDCLSSHRLATFRDKSPAEFIAAERGQIPFERSGAMVIGSAAHSLILEGEKVFNNEYDTGGPINEKTGNMYGRETKKFQTWMQENNINPDKLLSEVDKNMAYCLKRSADANPVIVDILNEGQAEKVIRAELHGVLCQIRCDWLSPIWGHCDLKTTADLSRFERDARYKFNYIGNLAFYRDVISAAIGEDFPKIPSHFMVIETKRPYRSGVFSVTEELLNQHSEINKASMGRLKNCRELDKWPSLYEGLTEIGVNR